MKIDTFDYHLPVGLIAQFPLEERSASRMLYVNPASSVIRDDHFIHFPDYMRAGDVLILNDTRVIKARLHGVKQSGGKVEVMIERILDGNRALAMIRASHAPPTGSILLLEQEITAVVEARQQSLYILSFPQDRLLDDVLERHGKLPLPPYIDRAATRMDEDRYQTVFAHANGAVAAPTAGLHFDEVILTRLRQQGISIAYVTLHVGAGTFQPIKATTIEEHVMHAERYHISAETIDTIQQCHARGGQVLAVGTTCLRALEACAQANDGDLRAGGGETRLFITPGFNFQVVDRLLTNFHLPRSTLLMLVSAFSGIETIQGAYQHAIAARYRFFSYGDAMLLEKNV
ncbi:MAG: tRNA preQ1(34) S-adenosylmethionine ribosyltransferase-isomerase QueA [Nitrosomonas sp.]|nr:tRNA preQ1(34) S-adenosylmethionine ribosyltransferase-isomerase QueA [Nitrosomonas sp.]